jgi:regulatory protein
VKRASTKAKAGGAKRKPSQDRLFADDEKGERISAIEPLEADPNLRRVRVNGKARVTLRSTDIDLLRLHIGVEWTDALVRRVDAAMAKLKCHAMAMRLLGKRDFSQAELVARLEKHGHSMATAKDVAGELARNGWIDDARRAESILRATIRSRPASKRLLMDRMISRGIDSKRANATVATSGAESEIDSAVALAKQKLRLLASSDPATAKRRVSGLLVRRGFEEDVVTQALDRIGLGGDDHYTAADAGDHD